MLSALSRDLIDVFSLIVLMRAKNFFVFKIKKRPTYKHVFKSYEKKKWTDICLDFCIGWNHGSCVYILLSAWLLQSTITRFMASFMVRHVRNVIRNIDWWRCVYVRVILKFHPETSEISVSRTECEYLWMRVHRRFWCAHNKRCRNKQYHPEIM